MTAITLESIKAEQERLAGLINTYANQLQPNDYEVPATTIKLFPGERYAGIALGTEGQPSHHLILLPGEIEEATWAKAGKWAAKNGCDLPSRQEQALLFANLRGEFASTWYWSNQEHESDSSRAWGQLFTNGIQDTFVKGVELRARAVRRLIID
ncbi:DUF1566 domain-containing protein [Pusillimonas sp. DMV24BSW_D]|uniref:DUF1566 domain-containing protein n=1 Tax=Neopusillimonas aestuarii TaxID=2716226 RepID=UPI00140C4B25|nr:DUF1566 domain-containing protein [Pusillimonas sp. DMV24BSW_D]QIM48961.1 DUF1566 domain-containing protein [Pusillimonas sp. DMV24BSW_D]